MKPTDEMRERAANLATTWVLGSERAKYASHFIAEALCIERARAIEECAQVAERASLPQGYQWGCEAMGSFNFGKERAATAIRAFAGKD